MHGRQALHSVDRTLKIHSGTNKLISDELGYSGVVSQPIVDFHAADNCRLDVTTMKAMNFHLNSK